MKGTLIDVLTASQILNLTPQQVRKLCRSGKFPCQKIGANWILQEKAVRRYYDRNSCGVAEDHISYLAPAEKNNVNKPTALSFFSGAMGLDIGLERAGFNILLACETDNACRKTINKNRPRIALIGDIRSYNSADIRRISGLKPDEDLDLIVGGPPCQAFSTAGKRQGFEDERGNLLLTFLDMIIALNPRFAVIENVRGILSAPLKFTPHNLRINSLIPQAPDEANGSVLLRVLTKLESAGYGISFNLYNAANFGTPQIRERVIIVCSRDGNKLPYLVPTNAKDGIFGLPPWRTFKDVAGNLPSSTYISFPEKRLKYYKLLKPGQYWKHLPINLQKEALGKSYFANGGKTGFYRRLGWDRPSPTLVTHPAMPATDLAHPIEDRPLSIEEYKRIQEFPDNWIIEGTLIEQYRQVGNAVPVSLGHAIGQLLINYMNGHRISMYSHFPYSRYKNTDDKTWITSHSAKNDLYQIPLVK